MGAHVLGEEAFGTESSAQRRLQWDTVPAVRVRGRIWVWLASVTAEIDRASLQPSLWPPSLRDGAHRLLLEGG